MFVPEVIVQVEIDLSFLSSMEEGRKIQFTGLSSHERLAKIGQFEFIAFSLRLGCPRYPKCIGIIDSKGSQGDIIEFKNQCDPHTHV
mmetsp:Transcript_1853/g.6583  ORF Transcript_1853/g.6583 Transcript_1853/m.6583 type:complete len:87 (+) Transcript_1853:2240-2500(+)